MFKILNNLRLGDTYCISIEGDIYLLKKGTNLYDEKGNSYKIKNVALSRYNNIKDYEKYAEIELQGDVDNIGKILYLSSEDDLIVR